MNGRDTISIRDYILMEPCRQFDLPKPGDWEWCFHGDWDSLCVCPHKGISYPNFIRRFFCKLFFNMEFRKKAKDHDG